MSLRVMMRSSESPLRLNVNGRRNRLRQVQSKARVCAASRTTNQRFYTYLKTLAWCDLAYCALVIVDKLALAYHESMVKKSREMKRAENDTQYNTYNNNQLVLVTFWWTRPVLNTLKMLSNWLVCAFSIHRCHSLIRLVKPPSVETIPFSFHHQPQQQHQQQQQHNHHKIPWSHSVSRLSIVGEAPGEMSHIRVSDYSPSTAQRMVSHCEPSVARQKASAYLNRERFVVLGLVVLAFIYLLPQLLDINERSSTSETLHKNFK